MAQPMTSQQNRDAKEEERLTERVKDERVHPDKSQPSEADIDAMEHRNPTGAPIPVEDLTGDLKKESRAKAERMAGVTKEDQSLPQGKATEEKQK